MKRIKIIECKACEGTGLYKGWREHGGAAVVCRVCKGTGYNKFIYTEFHGRKEREDVTRVFPDSSFGVNDVDTKMDDGSVVHYSQYGCTYEEWKNGVEPKPVEDLQCPFLASWQEKRLPKCDIGCGLGQRITQCKFYNKKEECWKEWHELYD